jgi:lysozyme
MGRAINSAGVDLVKHFEGKYNKAYYCPAGVLTIGYGHTNGMGHDLFSEGDEWSTQRCEDVLEKDLSLCGSEVLKLVKVELNDDQYSSLCSFVFNLGAGSLASSTCLKKLNQGDYISAAEWIIPWNKAKVKGRMIELEGLKRRRRAEAALFLSDYDIMHEALSL